MHIIVMVNRLDDMRYAHIHLDSKSRAVRGESIGKAVRDLMRLSSGLRYLEYVLLCTVVFKRRYIYMYKYFSTFSSSV